MNHYVKKIPDLDYPKEYCYAVMWEDIIICLCSKAKWATTIAYTLNAWQEHCRNENISIDGEIK